MQITINIDLTDIEQPKVAILRRDDKPAPFDWNLWGRTWIRQAQVFSTKHDLPVNLAHSLQRGGHVWEDEDGVHYTRTWRYSQPPDFETGIQQIALGHIHVRNVGKKGRNILLNALEMSK